MSIPVPRRVKEPQEMKKILLAMLLVAAVTAVAQTTPAPAPQKPATPTPQNPAPAAAPQNPAPAPAAPQQKKEIKDPAEYNAYIGALGQQDPAAKISGFEAFITQYPNTVMKEEALEQLMSAYQLSGNQAKVIETAQKLLQANPNNLKALVLLAYGKRITAKTPQDLAEAAQYGEKGLQLLPTAPKPEGVSDADYCDFQRRGGHERVSKQGLRQSRTVPAGGRRERSDGREQHLSAGVGVFRAGSDGEACRRAFFHRTGRQPDCR